MSPGLLSNSTSASAKLSPTQLYSARLEVFSNGNTITTSTDAFCANARGAGESRVKKRKSAVNKRNFKAQTPRKKTQRSNCSRKLHLGLNTRRKQFWGR